MYKLMNLQTLRFIDWKIIDILKLVLNDQLVFVENKILTKEHSNQLEDIPK